MPAIKAKRKSSISQANLDNIHPQNYYQADWLDCSYLLLHELHDKLNIILQIH
jgi:hypothetical protein